MISVDTNVIISALNQKDVNHLVARQLLSEHGSREAPVISPVVYAELMAAPGRDGVRAFLERAEIAALVETLLELWEKAGTTFGDDAVQRRKGQLPRRIVADFVSAAHAAHHDLKVMTLDRAVYDAAFSIEVIST